MSWGTVAAWFALDGALRDIYVHDTTLHDWQAFLDALPRWSYPTSWSIDGRLSAPPTSAEAAFTATRQASTLLTIDVASVRLQCHFFTSEEIELDLDPKAVREGATFDALLTFLARLGDHLRKQVELTMESSPEAKIVTYSPATRSFAYHAAPKRPNRWADGA